jgi:hypothetical protein
VAFRCADGGGVAAVRDVARVLLAEAVRAEARRPAPWRALELPREGGNLKGALMERGGAISLAPCAGGRRGNFLATASLGPFEATSPPHDRQADAERHAAGLVLVAAALLSEEALASALFACDARAMPFSRAEMAGRASGCAGVVPFKSMLMDRGGAVEGAAVAREAFVATATWRAFAATSEVWPSKRAAEAAAAEAVLRAAGLLPRRG